MSYSSKSCFVCAGPEAPSSPLPSQLSHVLGAAPNGLPHSGPSCSGSDRVWPLGGTDRSQQGRKRDQGVCSPPRRLGGWGGVLSHLCLSPSSNTADLGLPRLPGPELGAPAPSPIPLEECHLVPAKTLMKTSTAHRPPPAIALEEAEAQLSLVVVSELSSSHGCDCQSPRALRCRTSPLPVTLSVEGTGRWFQTCGEAHRGSHTSQAPVSSH